MNTLFYLKAETIASSNSNTQMASRKSITLPYGTTVLGR